MPVQEGDRVTAIDVTTGIETVVSIPPTDPNVRPIILDEEIGLITLARLSELAEDGFLEPTSFFETTYFMPMGDVPYIDIGQDGDTITYEYVPTSFFDPSLDYQVISSAGSGIADMTGDEERQRRGGVGGRGGGGGGGGSGQQEGQGEGSDEPPIEPFPPIQEPDLEHTCSDEDPIPGEGEGEGEGEPKPPCAACAAGIPKGGKGEGEGEGQGSPSGSGQNQGPGMGEGQGEGTGEGQGEGSGEGSGEGEGSGSGEGSGQGQGAGEGSGSGQGQGEGEGSGEGSGEGQGEPSDSGQPIPNGAGQASGGTPSNGGGPPSPPGPPGPPNGEENDLLEELLREQELRETERQEEEEREESEGGPDPDDFMREDEESTPSETDNYDDIFDESPDIDDSGDESPDEFMDIVPPSEPSDRPFEDLSDEELQRLIDELMNQPEPTPGPGQSPTSPDATGPNQRQPPGGTPETPVSPNLDIPQGQSWLWINTLTGQLDNGVERPPVGPWVHVLFMVDMQGQNTTNIMTFDNLRRMVSSDVYSPTIFQPVPTTMVLEFEDASQFTELSNTEGFMTDTDGYWEVVAERSSLTLTIQIMPNIDTDGPQNRWVPVGIEEEVSSDVTRDINQEMQELLEQINQENEIANERGIPTGYGEGSTSPYVPDNESNAAAQQESGDAGARAGKGDAKEARNGASSETNAARQEAQEAARNVNQANDLESAMEGTERAVENAMKANASADPSNESDVSNRNQAITAANDALNGLEELLSDQPMDEEISELVNDAREDLNNLEIGEGISLSQSFAETARGRRDEAMNAASPEEALEAAKLATEAAVEARRAAIEGDSEDREAVQEAQNMAQQAIDAANEAGEDTSSYQQLLDQQPDFNDLGELSEDAEARNRDTLPGEFADINNPEVVEDMMNVARRATEIAEEALGQANPTNQDDVEAARYIQGQANSAVDNVAGRWDGNPEEIADLRQRIQDAAAELDRRAETMCALWNATSQTWYRGMNGKILIFENIDNTLAYGVQKGLIEEDFIGVPENWREMPARPIGTGGEI